MYYPNHELYCKSFSWSLLPEGQVHYFKALCMSILCCKGSITSFYEDIIKKLYNDIKNIIITKDLQLLLKYAPTIKTCSTSAKHIIDQFPDLITHNKIAVVWLGAGPGKSKRTYPVLKLECGSPLNEKWNHINIGELMGNTIGQCKKLVGKMDTIAEMRNAFIEQDETQVSSYICI